MKRGKSLVASGKCPPFGIDGHPSNFTLLIFLKRSLWKKYFKRTAEANERAHPKGTVFSESIHIPRLPG